MANQVFKTWAGIGLALALGGAGAAGETIHIHQSYNGPWHWDELTMTKTTQGDGLHETTVYKGTAAITGYSGDSTDLVVPEKISWNGYITASDGSVSIHYSYEVEVREIKELITPATSVTIPNTVTNIQRGAFSDEWETGLPSTFKTIVLGSGVKSIGAGAFNGCRNLTAIVIPDSVESIGGCAFWDCTGLSSIVIPDNVVSIGEDAFSCCTGLESVSIGEGIQYLGAGAFSGCNNLGSIAIFGNVINDCYPEEYRNNPSPFAGCGKLVQATLGSKMKKIPAGLFWGCAALSDCSIPGSVESIGEHAFDGCVGLSTLTIPNRVTNLGTSAFSGCTALSSVTLAEGLKGIGDSAFNGCYRLRKIDFPASLEEVGTRAFYGCTALGTVGLGGVKRIGDQAFSGCTALKEAVLPESARIIGAGAFQGCTALGTVAFPAGVEAVDAGAFSGASVKTLLFDNTEGAFLEDFSKESLRTLSLGAHARGVTGARLADCTALALVLVDKGNGEYKVDGTGALYDKTGAELIKYPAGLAAEKMTVPATVRRVGERAFAHSMSLKEVEFQGPVDSIGEGAFDWCLALEKVVFPSGVGQIGAGAFRVCPSLETLRFEGSGNAVLAFGGGQFAYAKPVVQIEESEASRWASTLAGLGLSYESIEEEGGTATMSTPVAVPHEWLERKAARILAENGGDYESAAGAVASNGVNKVWECYLAGLEPEAEGEAFVTALSFSNGTPKVSWTPDLNEGGRKKERAYVVEGSETLESWGKTNGASRFYRVKVGMP